MLTECFLNGCYTINMNSRKLDTASRSAMKMGETNCLFDAYQTAGTGFVSDSPYSDVWRGA